MQAGLAPLLARYAGRFHALTGQGHGVASPLGAWLLLALCGPASQGEDRAAITDALGCGTGEAAGAAAALLAAPHPLVAAAVATWRRRDADTEALTRWLAGLPPAAQHGVLTDQADLDRWAREHTYGLIERFPVQLTPDMLLVLASALATRVSWQRPFELAAGRELGPASPWAGRLRQVLRTPAGPGHSQFVAATADAGDVAVHTARARGGLLVTSVAAAPEVPAQTVLAAAHQLAIAAALGGEVERRSLFDLPLGEGPLGTVTERQAMTQAPSGREENCHAVLPAWAASSEHNLARPALGFPAAASALAGLLALGSFRYEAKQSAMARYSRVGFEAAAVTAVAVAMAAPLRRPGAVRTATLRFGHPFAVVAVTADDPGGQPAGPWHGLPVFSAWVADPQDADIPHVPSIRNG